MSISHRLASSRTVVQLHRDARPLLGERATATKFGICLRFVQAKSLTSVDMRRASIVSFNQFTQNYGGIANTQRFCVVNDARFRLSLLRTRTLNILQTCL